MPNHFPSIYIRTQSYSRDTTAANSSLEGDHRKRRRNHTTPSCLNCHTSKRMCDRRHPCGRSTQLGLTGLCVYEVDNPSQRGNAQDESPRLETVIRELKYKPHPRWAKSVSSPGTEFEICHARARSRFAESVVESPRRSDLSPHPNSHVVPVRDSAEDQVICGALQPDYPPSSFSSPPTGSASTSVLIYSPLFDMHSPPSAPSTGITTSSQNANYGRRQPTAHRRR